jgi:hypothetical protein
MVGDWRRLHNEELHNLYTSPDTIRVIKSRRVKMGRAHTTHGRDNKCIKNFDQKI